eukprot:8484336-Lingulodinium_polyedra.AAC.1
MREALRPRTVDSTASLCTFLKPCAMMRPNRPSVAAAARKSHASRTPCGRHVLVFVRSVRDVRFAGRCGRG